MVTRRPVVGVGRAAPSEWPVEQRLGRGRSVRSAELTEGVDGENHAEVSAFGGGGGIRTLEGFNPLHAFQACALDQTMRPLRSCDGIVIAFDNRSTRL